MTRLLVLIGDLFFEKSGKKGREHFKNDELST